MKQRGNIKAFLAVILVLILAGVAILLWIGRLNNTDSSMDNELGRIPESQSEDLQEKEVTLFFGTEADSWHTEKRNIVITSARIEDKMRQVVNELLKGPTQGGANPVPADTRLMSIFFDKEGIVYLDFSEEIRKNHPGGTWGELMTIYSIVNTLIDNFDVIKGIKILVMGKEIETLKGHIDARHPFTFRKAP